MVTRVMRKRSVQTVSTNGDICVEVSEVVTSVRATGSTITSASRDHYGTVCVGVSVAGVCVRAPFGVLSSPVST